MSDDLVKRLRAAVSDEEASLRTIDAVDEAADAIERKDAALRVALDALMIAETDFNNRGLRHDDYRQQKCNDAIAKIEESLK